MGKKISSLLVGFGFAILALPLCLSGMRMLAETSSGEYNCPGRKCQMANGQN